MKAGHIPELERHCGSWVATRRATGEVIGEFFNRANVERFNPETVHVQTTLQYLVGLNAALRDQKDQ